MSKPCEKCPEGDTSRTTNTVICLCCKQQKPIKEVVDGICKDCLQQHLGYTLQTIRVCSKCGKQVKYFYNRQTSPCCNAPILTVTKILKKEGETNAT